MATRISVTVDAFDTRWNREGPKAMTQFVNEDGVPTGVQPARNTRGRFTDTAWALHERLRRAL